MTDPAGSGGQPGTPRNQVPDAVLRSVGFLAFFDRFGTPPMLVVLADRTELSLGQAVQLVAAYALLYAVGQPLWGLFSDRFGRMAVLRTALVGVLLGALASTLFSSYLPLLLARSFTGLMAGALYPTLLTILGDTRTGIERARGLSDLQIYSSLGTTIATLATGTLAALVDWRLVFALPALGCLVLLVYLRGAGTGRPAGRGGMRLGHAFSPSALGIYGLAVLEGAVLMGILTYIVPALQHAGVGVSLAGVLAAGFGIGVILGARLMRRLVHRFTRTQLIGIGGSVLVAAFLVSSLWQVPAALTATALLIGVSNAVLHSSMQGWATDIAPQARATSVSLFAGSLFLGSSLYNFLTAGLADNRQYGTIFLLGLIASVLLTAAATTGHAAWKRTHS
ncbi:MFS superfamily transporter [Arthrobacter crystallopoietes BAB-32]|uniref:MFS superfamily transporter n=1 Tax=Arthrobacter crystallopoietes BAB-32 TaxID=1246476 RepID=N1UTX0_9MICC|nr:MFS transporter [Arthrobacter crystallopoietes]EMY33851.1 MFS superfamily transporter [Arthrobacter crystallopoietes BAB-32]